MHDELLKAPGIGVGNNVGIDVGNFDVRLGGLGTWIPSHLLASHLDLYNK